jgi:predicted ester cyclase
MDDLDRRDPAAASEKFDADKYYSHAWEGDLRETWRKQVETAKSGAMTDFETTTRELVAEGDRVVCRTTFSFTHSGTLFGVPATGRRLAMTTFEMWRIDGGKIVEHWGGMREAVRAYAALAANPVADPNADAGATSPG